MGMWLMYLQAYGNVGLSIKYHDTLYSLSGVFSNFGKVSATRSNLIDGFHFLCLLLEYMGGLLMSCCCC